MILFAAEQCLTLLCPLLAQTTFWHEVPAPCLLVTVYRDIPYPFLLQGPLSQGSSSIHLPHTHLAINNGTSFSPELSRICLW